MDGSMEGWMDEWMYKVMDGWMDGYTDLRNMTMGGMGGWTRGCAIYMYVGINGWMGGWICRYMYLYKKSIDLQNFPPPLRPCA